MKTNELIDTQEVQIHVVKTVALTFDYDIDSHLSNVSLGYFITK